MYNNWIIDIEEFWIFPMKKWIVFLLYTSQTRQWMIQKKQSYFSTDVVAVDEQQLVNVP